MSTILLLEIDGNKIQAERSNYVNAKLKQLREFGYSNITRTEVDEQLDAVLAGKTMENGLTIIGTFMRDEVKGKK